MKKKLIALILAMALPLSFTACSGNKNTESKKTETSNEGGNLKAEKKLLSVEVTLPASLVGDSSTALTEEAKAAGVKQITTNEDGSITMKMNKKAHKELLNTVKTGIDEGIDEILSDKENYPSFEEITYNDDVTEFTVKVDPASYGGMQIFAAFAFYLEGNIYQTFNAVPSEQVKTVVNFVNKDTDEVIESGDSSSLDDTGSSQAQ